MEKYKILWKDIWTIEVSRIGFLIRVTRVHRMIQLEAQSRALVSCSNSGNQENHHQCLTTQADQLKHANYFCSRRHAKMKQGPIKDKIRRDGDGTVQANAGGCWPTTHSSTRDCSHKPEARPGSLVQCKTQGLTSLSLRFIGRMLCRNPSKGKSSGTLS